MAHSKIGASSMYRWGACPGSVKLSEGIPASSSSAAEEGTIAHDHASFFLENFGWKDGIDEEMKEAVKVYTDYCTSVRDARVDHDRNLFLVEHKFNLSSLFTGLYGTADCVIYDAFNRILHVIDYKHGVGIAVEAVGNPQLRYYGLGALLTLDLPVVKVVLTIVQPRSFHPAGSIRSEEIGADDLVDFAADLVAAAKATQDPNAVLVSGDHCRFCPAAAICPKLHEQALVTAKEHFSPTEAYDPKVLAKALDMVPTLKAFVKSVEEFAEAEANRGRVPPGYKMVEGRGSRVWRTDIDVEQELLINMGLAYTEVMETSFKSVAQIEKALDKAGKEELKKYYKSVNGSPKLAHESDKRKPISASIGAEFTTQGE